MPVLLALLFALVIAAFFVSRRAGWWMLAGASAAVAAMFVWTWYTQAVPETRVDAIPVEQVEIVDSRIRYNLTEHLIRNNSDSWTLTAIRSEKIARLEDGTVVDREEFTHHLEIPPGQTSWEPFRFFGLEIGLEYEWRIIGTEGRRAE